MKRRKIMQTEKKTKTKRKIRRKAKRKHCTNNIESNLIVHSHLLQRVPFDDIYFRLQIYSALSRIHLDSVSFVMHNNGVNRSSGPLVNSLNLRTTESPTE